MRRGFRSGRRGTVVLQLDEAELVMLDSLAADLAGLVAPEDDDTGDLDPLAVLVGLDDDGGLPEDPAVARLLPDAYPDDPEASTEFRRFTGRGLREAKVERAVVVRAAIAAAVAEGRTSVPVAAPEAAAWLGVLNDLRLVLASRLDITDEEHDELRSLPEDDPRSVPMAVYDWLTWLQDSLLRALGAPDPADPDAAGGQRPAG